MDSHSPQADAILKRYSLQPDSGTMDVKAFSALVRDVHLPLTFDRDGSGTLDAEELRPALKSLGLDTSDRQCEAILRAWDHDRSGKLDLLEFTELVKSLQTFSKFDRDGSGDIDIGEQPSLAPLGLPWTPPPRVRYSCGTMRTSQTDRAARVRDARARHLGVSELRPRRERLPRRQRAVCARHEARPGGER